MEKLNYKLVNTLLIIVIVFLISQGLSIYKDIILLFIETIFPIFLAFFISYSLYPCVKFINKKLSYNVSCFLTILICITVITTLVYISIPILREEITVISEDIYNFLNKLSFLEIEATNYLKSFLSLDKGLSIINSGATLITKIIIVIVLTIYFLINMPKTKNYLNKYELFKVIDKDLFNYYKGFYLVILIEIIEYFIIYFLIGHPHFLLIAILSGITSVIPFIGAIFTNIIALITSLTIGPELFIATAITMIIVPIFNSYVIEPKIYNKTLKVSLISIIISCFVFGYLFGFLGILFAIPIFLILKNLLIFFLLHNDKI